MRRTTRTVLTILVALAAVGASTVTTAQASVQASATGQPATTDRLGRAVLPPNDGWASADGGTTGGSAATPDQVFVVHDRAELVAALGGDNASNGGNATPKIIYVAGTVRGLVDDANQPLTCDQVADPEYSLEAFLVTYDPAVWGRTAPAGPLEEARLRSVRNQSARTVINVGPNTTIVGLRGARMIGLTLMINAVRNVIVRNIEFQDAFDCFPRWSPTDGAEGNWNSEYDNVSVRRSSNVWVDHCTFNDGDRPDSAQPVHFGRPYQVHDGLLDITHGSDLATVSYNRLHHHNKTMLIGSTDNPSMDRGKLRVTVHHNAFDTLVQRLPRVRFGQVDLYNNLYRVPDPDGFDYAWGVGVESALYAENNFVALGEGVTADTVIRDWGGTAMTERGTWVRLGTAPPRPMSLLAAYNATHDPDIAPDAGWTPTLRPGHVLPAPVVPVVVALLAGAGRPIVPN